MFRIVFCLAFLWVNQIFGQEIDLAKNFPLKNVDGKMVSPADYPDAKGFILIFTCNHCPFAKLYPPRFNQLHRQFNSLGVPLFAISSTDTVEYEDDGFPYMIQKASKENFEFPYLMDGSQELAKQFKAQKTPHAYVIWKVQGKWQIQYDGAIDDNGANPEKVERSYVKEAVESLLAGRPIKEAKTASIGCQIYFRNP